MRQLEKLEEAYDRGYQTGIVDALQLAQKLGHHDFREALLRDVNRRADDAGLPRIGDAKDNG